MFDSSLLVVQSAVSAFNNAALSTPAFLWWGILNIPLFLVVYFFGKSFLQKVNWSGERLKLNVCFFTVISILVWTVLFSGNYNVLRDDNSILSFVVATITFSSSLFIGEHLRKYNLPKWKEISRTKRRLTIFALILFFLAVILSDIHVWWGPILQFGAVIFGFFLGRLARDEPHSILGVLLIALITTVAMLMQPEFFRFGQLGELSAFHLVFIALLGLSITAVIALRNIRPKARLKKAVYVSLKWLMRLLSLLCLILFVLTESVPIFLGMLIILFLFFALSIWHSREISPNLSGKVFAVVLCLFGMITVMPLITSLGILYWVSLPKENFWKQVKFLL